MRNRYRSIWFLGVFVFSAIIAPTTFRFTSAVAQTLSSWTSANDGSWANSSNWSTAPSYPNNGVPNAGNMYDVVVDSPHTVSVSDVISVSSLTIDSPEANVLVEGGIFNTPTINVNQGRLSLGTMSFGTVNEIRNATVSGAGTFHIDNGILRDITLATDASVYLADIEGDLTLNGATVSVDRELRLFGGQMQTISGQGMLKLKKESDLRYSHLTIGPDMEVEFTAGDQDHTMNGQTLVNHGTIRAVSSTRMINADITNYGTIDVARYVVVDGAAWRNLGTVRVRPNAAFILRGSLESDGIGTIIDEGARQISLGADIDNVDRTFDLASLNLAAPVSLYGATIRGGTLTSSVATTYEIINSVALDDVTVLGDLSFMHGRAFVDNDLTLNAATVEVEEVQFNGSPRHELNGNGTLVVRSIYGNELIIGEQVVVRNSAEPPVSFPDTFDITFKENRGTIIAEPESDVYVGQNLPEWRNAGLIRVPDGRIEFRGNYNIDDIGNIETPGSEVVLGGVVANAGKTIRLDETTGGWSFVAQVLGGRIEVRNGVEATLNSQLRGVTLSGPSRIGQPRFDSPWLSIYDELTLDDATLSIPDGRFLGIGRDDEGNSAPIRGQGEIVLLGSDPDNARVEGAVTVGPGVVIRTGTRGRGTVGFFQAPINNDGIIRAESEGSVLRLMGDINSTGMLSAVNNGTLEIFDESWANQGTVHVEDARMEINSTSFENGVDGLLTGAGELAVTGEFVNNGEIAIGAPIGNLAIDGRVRLDVTSRVAFEIGGTSDGEFDTLRIDGDLFVGGQLDVVVSDDFLLQPNQKFDMVEISGFVFGQFDGLTEGALVGTHNDVDLFITYSAGDRNDITLYTDFPGDFDSDFAYTAADVDALNAAIFDGNDPLEFDLTGDGVVDTADLLDWLSEAGETNVGPGATYLIGDLDFDRIVNSNDLGILLNRFGDSGDYGWSAGNVNGDTIVDQADLGLLLNNFNRVATASPTAVPEPGSHVFLSWALCLACLVRRR